MCADANSLLELIAFKNKNGNDRDNNNDYDDDDVDKTRNGNGEHQPRLPDVIVSDVRMPESDKNDYELVEFLRLAPSAMNNDNSNYNSNNKAAPPLPLSLPFLASLKTISIVLLTAKAMTDDWIKGIDRKSVV